jgi:hypothetical protein
MLWHLRSACIMHVSKLYPCTCCQCVPVQCMITRQQQWRATGGCETAGAWRHDQSRIEVCRTTSVAICHFYCDLVVLSTCSWLCISPLLCFCRRLAWGICSVYNHRPAAADICKSGLMRGRADGFDARGRHERYHVSILLESCLCSQLVVHACLLPAG